MKIAADVLDVLSRASASDSFITVPPGQLDRKLSEATNKVLEAMGGKWNRKAKAHLFEACEQGAAGLLDAVLATGDVLTKQDLGAFYTPPDLASDVVDRADIGECMLVLEPNVGGGALALAARLKGAFVRGFDINAKAAAAAADSLAGEDCRFDHADFLTVTPEPIFDRVVMNPPFAKQADIDHVMHAHRFLKSDGRLVAIMSAGVMFRENAKTVRFRDFVAEHGGSIEALPPESFKASGTSVSTCLVVMNA